MKRVLLVSADEVSITVSADGSVMVLTEPVAVVIILDDE